MARIAIYLVLLSLGFPATGKVIHRDDLNHLQERAAKNVPRERHNRYDLEPPIPNAEDDNVVELEGDKGKEAVVLYEDKNAKREAGNKDHQSQAGNLLQIAARVGEGDDRQAVLREARASTNHKATANDIDEIGKEETGEESGVASGDSTETLDLEAHSQQVRGEGGNDVQGDAPEITKTQGHKAASKMTEASNDDSHHKVDIPSSDGNTLDHIIKINVDAGVDEKFAEGDIAAPLMSKGSPKRDATTNQNLKWPKNGNFVLVPYTTSGINTEATNALKGAIDDIQRISCVRIIPRTTEADYVNVVSNGGCWASLGRGGGKQDISLGPGCEHVGTALHEFYHALGFWHEQTRMDRDQYISIFWNHINPELQGNFQKYDVGQADYYGHGYDPQSIMHYGNYAFSADGQKTIALKSNPNVVLSGGSLTSIDIGQLNALYGCNRNCDAFPHTTETVVNSDKLRDQLNDGLRVLSANSNADIAQRFHNFITQCQYPSYFATVTVYADVTGYDYHALIGYDVSFLFRTHGKNFVAYTKPHQMSTISPSDQQNVLNQVVAANTDQGCNAKASAERAWNIASSRGGRFVHVLRHGFGASGQHSVANSKHANYRCKRSCIFWSCSETWEFLYIGF